MFSFLILIFLCCPQLLFLSLLFHSCCCCELHLFFRSLFLPHPFFWKYFSPCLVLLIKGLYLFCHLFASCPVLIPPSIHLSICLFSLFKTKRAVSLIPSGLICKQHFFFFCNCSTTFGRKANRVLFI